MSRWPKVCLREVAKIDRDGIDPGLIPDGSIYVGLEHIESGGRLINVATVSNGDLASTKFRFGSKHLLYGKLRPYLAKIALPNFEGVCSTDILPVLPSNRLDRTYLAFFLRQPRMVEYANSRAEGANLPRLSPKALAEFEIPLPPLPEQKRIAAILDLADEMRRKRFASIAAADELPQAIFGQLFGAAKATQDGWPTVTLADVVRSDDQINYGVVQPGPEMESGIPLIRVSNVVANDFSADNLKKIDPAIEAQYERSRLHGDEVLVACVGSIGAVALANPELSRTNIARAVARIRVDERKADRLYVAEFLRLDCTQRYFRAETRAVAQPTLNIKQLSETPILLPPITVQREFARRIAEATRLRSSLASHLARLDALFASLQDRAFNGELTSDRAASELEMVG